MFIVDTDILIDVQRRFPPALDWIATLEEPLTTTGFTVLELIQDSRNQEEVIRARQLVSRVHIVWPSPLDCEAAVPAFERFHLSHGVGLLDILIAFTAIGLDAELMTFNTKHFQSVGTG